MNPSFTNDYVYEDKPNFFFLTYFWKRSFGPYKSHWYIYLVNNDRHSLLLMVLIFFHFSIQAFLFIFLSQLIFSLYLPVYLLAFLLYYRLIYSFLFFYLYIIFIYFSCHKRCGSIFFFLKFLSMWFRGFQLFSEVQ